MRRFIIFDLFEKLILEKIYDKAREAEKQLPSTKFTAYYLPQTCICWFFLLIMMAIITVVFWKFNKSLFYLGLVILFLTFFMFLYHVSYKCHISEEGINSVFFYLFPKKILWKDIAKIESYASSESNKSFNRELIFKNRQKKTIYSISYELVGFNLIIERCREKNIKIENHFES